MRRRDFLVAGAAAVGWSLTGRHLGATETPRPDLVLAKGEPAAALNKALGAIGGLQRFLHPGQVVAVKPNASFIAAPAWGATTHPAVLRAVVAACVTAGARRVLVLDHTMAAAQRCFARSGTAEALDGIPQAKLVSLDKERLYKEVAVPDGESLQRTAIAVAALRADLLINLPTAKSHSATGVSFGLKNLMGLVWDRQTFHHDMDVHVGVVDLATVLKPQLTILDAMEVLRTRGPSGPGEVTSLGGLVVGTDPVAVDAYAVGLSTWNNQTLRPHQVDHIRRAAQRGLGRMDLDSLTTLDLS